MKSYHTHITYLIASKQKPFACRPQPCTWIQCLQGQPLSAAKLCASIHLGQWRDSTFHGPTAADFVIGLWKLEPCQAHKHRILRDNFCAIRVFKQTISQASQPESNAMLLRSMQAKDAVSVIWFGSIESFSCWKFHSKRKPEMTLSFMQNVRCALLNLKGLLLSFPHILNLYSFSRFWSLSPRSIVHRHRSTKFPDKKVKRRTCKHRARMKNMGIGLSQIKRDPWA